MAEMWIRGNFFQQALDYVKRKRGQQGLDIIRVIPEKYLPEQTYSFEEFCELLTKITKLMGHGDLSDFSKLAADMVRTDERWRLMFKGGDPKEIFSSTKRQSDRYQVGDFKTKKAENGKVVLFMELWAGKKEHQDIWAEFYKGRLEGVLELTGRTGTVEVKKKKKGYEYTILW